MFFSDLLAPGGGGTTAYLGKAICVSTNDGDISLLRIRVVLGRVLLYMLYECVGLGVGCGAGIFSDM